MKDGTSGGCIFCFLKRRAAYMRFLYDCKTFSFAFWEWLSGRCFGLFVSEFRSRAMFFVGKS